jgi:hypothetical protein
MTLVNAGTPPAPGFVDGGVHVFNEEITLASQPTTDVIEVARLPRGAIPLYGVIETDTSLGTATAAIGIAGTTGKYRAAATFRDRLLRRHIWNFNKKRVKLAQLSDAPVFGWTHAYQLPSDWVRNIAVYPDPAGINPTHDYEVEGRSIVADHGDIYLVYGARITDPNDFDEMFREALAYALAVELAVPLAKSATLRDRMDEAFQAYVMEAQTIDGQDDPPEYPPESGWADVRN